MSSGSKRLIINCGTSHVSAGVFSSGPAGLVLEDFATVDLDYDLSQEVSWVPTLLSATRDLVKRHRLSGGATVIGPGYQMLTKFIKVAVVGAERQEQTLAYEVAQNLPYPLSDTVWDKHVVTDDGVERELIILAAKSEVAERICGFVNGVGLVPETVAAATALDYNAYRFTHPDATEDALVINIGARAINLTFVTAEDFFVRNIGWGGNHLTQSLGDTIGRPFGVAETIKLSYYTSGTAENDEVGKHVERCGQAFLKKLSTELTRSIALFRRQRTGHNPSKVYLTGRGSLLPGLPEFLSEKLKVSVDFLNPAAALSVGGKVDTALLESATVQLSELVGEAAADHVTDGVKLNLLPPRIFEERAFKKKQPVVVAAAVVLAVAGVLPWLKTTQIHGALADQAKKLNRKIDPLEQLQNQIQGNSDRVAAVSGQIAKVEGLVNSKFNWINFLVDVQNLLHGVGDVWLDSLEVVRAPAPKAQPAPSSGGGGLFDSGRGSAADEPAEAAKPALELRLAGSMLDRENPTSPVSEDIRRKAQDLLDAFKRSSFISDVTGKKINADAPGVLKFELVLVVNPEKPL